MLASFAFPVATTIIWDNLGRGCMGLPMYNKPCFELQKEAAIYGIGDG
jgi:hypothetical protein